MGASPFSIKGSVSPSQVISGLKTGDVGNGDVLHNLRLVGGLLADFLQGGLLSNLTPATGVVTYPPYRDNAFPAAETEDLTNLASLLS